jgi:methionine salvage enolase-phosphatase E1
MTAPISHGLVLPDQNFMDWYNVTVPYTQAFPRVSIVRSPAGNDLNRFRNVSAVQAPNVWFNNDAVGHIRRNFPFFANFDGYILSYEHGAMKPNEKLYEVVERASGRRGAEILYLDDRPENIAAGAARGWQVILQESPEKTLAEIDKRGLLSR